MGQIQTSSRSCTIDSVQSQLTEDLAFAVLPRPRQDLALAAHSRPDFPDSHRTYSRDGRHAWTSTSVQTSGYRFTNRSQTRTTSRRQSQSSWWARNQSRVPVSRCHGCRRFWQQSLAHQQRHLLGSHSYLEWHPDARLDVALVQVRSWFRASSNQRAILWTSLYVRRRINQCSLAAYLMLKEVNQEGKPDHVISGYGA